MSNVVNEKFAELGAPRRIWAIAAIHGDVDRLTTLHDYLAGRFRVRDRVVYLGNYLGVESKYNNETMDELLAFRAALLSKPGLEPSDIVYLRGPAEEAWQRLLRLQFAPVPTQSLDKLLASGVETYLRLCGVSLNDTKSMAKAGSVAITRWTNQLRALQRTLPGHEALTCSMRRAAYTQLDATAKRVLFVPAGFDFSHSLDDQGESLWWTTASFQMSGRAQHLYSRVIRGFDSVNGGLNLEDTAVNLDGGCGRGGPLACASFTLEGKLDELIAVGGAGALENLPVRETVCEELESFAVEGNLGADSWTYTPAAAAQAG
jgi:hypothetical protein